MVQLFFLLIDSSRLVLTKLRKKYCEFGKMHDFHDSVFYIYSFIKSFVRPAILLFFFHSLRRQTSFPLFLPSFLSSFFVSIYRAFLTSFYMSFFPLFFSFQYRFLFLPLPPSLPNRFLSSFIPVL